MQNGKSNIYYMADYQSKEILVKLPEEMIKELSELSCQYSPGELNNILLHALSIVEQIILKQGQGKRVVIYDPWTEEKEPIFEILDYNNPLSELYCIPVLRNDVTGEIESNDYITSESRIGEIKFIVPIFWYQAIMGWSNLTPHKNLKNIIVFSLAMLIELGRTIEDGYQIIVTNGTVGEKMAIFH